MTRRGAAVLPLAALLAAVGCGGGDDGGGTNAAAFTVPAPADQSGGLVRATVGNVGDTTARVSVYDAAGGDALATFVAEAPGAPVSFFFAISPGHDVRITVEDDAGAPSPPAYELTTGYEPVPDAFEPNDDEPAAAPMAAGTTLQGYLFAGIGEPTTAYDDFFRFSAAATTTRITLEDVPADLAARVFLFGPDGFELARVASGQKGAPLTMQPPLPLAAGDHVVRVALWAEAPATSGQGDAVPEHFTRPYRLTVTQP